MWRRKGLMQIHVNDIKIHITRAYLAENRVEIGTVVIQQTTCVVNHIGDVFDVTLKHAER